MKWLFFLFLFFPYFSLLGLYNGNPAAPEIILEGLFFDKDNFISVEVGYQRNWVLDRKMKVVTCVCGNMDIFSYVSDRGILTCNFLNRFSLYGEIGSARFNGVHNVIARRERNQYETRDQLIWGVGAKQVILNWEKATLGLDVKYERAKPQLRWMTQNGRFVAPISKSHLIFQEWQVGLGLGFELEYFFPYCALKYSNASGSIDNLVENFLPERNKFKIKNRRKFGLVFGCSFSNRKHFNLTIETRIIDEQAISFTGQIKL